MSNDEELFRICAYCGSAEGLTREHIWPSCLLDREDDDDRFSSVRTREGEKLVAGELTVRDVCSKCNNESLSVLDAYFCGLYDDTIQYYAQPGKLVVFKFDYDRLLRWLLKVGYNSARARKWPVKPTMSILDYVLHGGEGRRDLALMLQLIRPLRLPPGATDPRSGQPLFDKPDIYRVALIDPHTYPQFRFGLLIGIRSFQFYVFAKEAEMEGREWRKLIDQAKRGITGAYLLTPKSSAVRAYPCSQDLAQMAYFSPGLRRNMRLPQPNVRKRR